MSIQNALVFFREIESNIDFRKKCYFCKSKKELFELLDKQDIDFTPEEFEDAINSMLLKCQTYEQADHVRELHVWYLLFPD